MKEFMRAGLVEGVEGDVEAQATRDLRMVRMPSFFGAGEVRRALRCGVCF